MYIKVETPEYKSLKLHYLTHKIVSRGSVGPPSNICTLPQTGLFQQTYILFAFQFLNLDTFHKNYIQFTCCNYLIYIYIVLEILQKM